MSILYLLQRSTKQRGSTELKQTTLDALLRAYVKLEEITTELYNLADDAVDQGDFDDASLLQARANILYEQMENLDIVIEELGG